MFYRESQGTVSPGCLQERSRSTRGISATDLTASFFTNKQWSTNFYLNKKATKLPYINEIIWCWLQTTWTSSRALLLQSTSPASGICCPLQADLNLQVTLEFWKKQPRPPPPYSSTDVYSWTWTKNAHEILQYFYFCCSRCHVTWNYYLLDDWEMETSFEFSIKKQRNMLKVEIKCWFGFDS